MPILELYQKLTFCATGARQDRCPAGSVPGRIGARQDRCPAGSVPGRIGARKSRAEQSRAERKSYAPI